MKNKVPLLMICLLVVGCATQGTDDSPKIYNPTYVVEGAALRISLSTFCDGGYALIGGVTPKGFEGYHVPETMIIGKGHAEKGGRVYGIRCQIDVKIRRTVLAVYTGATRPPKRTKQLRTCTPSFRFVNASRPSCSLSVVLAPDDPAVISLLSLEPAGAKSREFTVDAPERARMIEKAGNLLEKLYLYPDVGKRV